MCFADFFSPVLAAILFNNSSITGPSTSVSQLGVSKIIPRIIYYLSLVFTLPMECWVLKGELTRAAATTTKKIKKNHHKTPLSFLGHSLKSQNKSGPMNGGRSPRLSPLESRKTTHDFFFSSDQEVSDIMTSSFQQMFLQKQRRVQTAAAACIRFPFTTTVHLNTNTVWNLSYDKHNKKKRPENVVAT